MRKIVPLFLVSTLLFSGIFSGAFSSAARAEAPIDTTGAATLGNAINEELQWRSNMTKILDQGILIDGKVAVEVKKDFYEVHMPHLYMLNKQGKLDVGIITAEIVPAPEKGAWLIRQADVPVSMTYYDLKNAPVAHITFASQKFSGTWYPAQAIFSKIDSTFQNIQVTPVNANFMTAKITALKSLIDLKDNGDGTWSGPADFGAAGLTITLPGQDPITASIGKVAARNKYDHLDMSQSLKMKDLAEKTMKDGLPQTEDQKKEFLAKLLTKSPFTANGLDTTFELGQVTVHDTGTKQQPRQDATLDQLTFAGQVANNKQDRSKILVKLGFNGLHATQVQPPFTDLLPSKVDAEIVLDNVPVSKLSEQFFAILTDQATVNAAKDTKDTKDPLAQKVAQDEVKKKISDAVALIPGILQDAGTSLAVNNTFIQSTGLTTRVQGRADASPDAKLGAAGKATVTFKGLDEYIEKTKAAAMRPGSDPHMMGFLLGLMAVQMKATADKAPDGTSIRNLMIELRKNGDIIVNGTVLNAKKDEPPADPNKP
jgi:hypothetical protein